MKVINYFHIIFWIIFQKGKANLFWQYHLMGMQDKFAYKTVKEKSNKYCKLLCKSLCNDKTNQKELHRKANTEVTNK